MSLETPGAGLARDLKLVAAVRALRAAAEQARLAHDQDELVGRRLPGAQIPRDRHEEPGLRVGRDIQLLDRPLLKIQLVRVVERESEEPARALRQCGVTQVGSVDPRLADVP